MTLVLSPALPTADPLGAPTSSEVLPPASIAGSSVAAPDIVEEWGRQSFPASDPPANW